MDGLLTYAVVSFSSLFAILSPFATVPPFLAMTADDAPEERASMAKRASLIACLVQASFALAGLTILDFFGISVPAFRIAGGLIVSRVSFEMLRGSRALKVTPEERAEGAEKDDISITPLGIPLLCGPGSITTAILLSSAATSWLHTGVLLANTVMIYALIYALLRVTSTYTHLFGETTIKVVTRLMGLLLLAMAVQFILDGVHGAGLAPGAPGPSGAEIRG